MQKWYVITGGPATGKSTLIELLAAQGRLVVPEAARMIVKEEQQKENSDCLPWGDLKKFQERVAQLQWESEQAAIGEEAFLDRSLIDGYAYSKYGAIEPPALIAGHARDRYAKVFLLEPLPDYINDAQRKETREFRGLIQPLIRAAYEEFGYEIINVPVLLVQERAAFILNALRS